MKKKANPYAEKEENVFSQSTGDLMAGLLFIFILLLMGALLQVQEKAEQDEEIVKRYDKIKTQLYIDLQEISARRCIVVIYSTLRLYRHYACRIRPRRTFLLLIRRLIP